MTPYCPTQDLYDQEKMYQCKADLLRLEVLWREGGIYIDADMVWLHHDLQNVLDACTSTGFFCGYECCNIVMSVILSGVCTIFICFAEDASALQRTHPQTYNTLVHGWHEFSPYPIEPILAGRPCGPVRAHYARIGTYRLCYRACVHAACTACVRATAEDRVGTIVESIEDGQ